METFGEYIKQLRTSRDLTITKISEEIGIDSTLWSRIERDERRPSKDVISKIAITFNQNEKDLLQKYYSDNFAYKIIGENIDVKVLRVAERKVKYLKMKGTRL